MRLNSKGNFLLLILFLLKKYSKFSKYKDTSSSNRKKNQFDILRFKPN
jgi:hypothetical protein